ncbi:MAG: transglycosylase domain-containing protein [Candidatus Promineifilaceae bacterium]
MRAGHKQAKGGRGPLKGCLNLLILGLELALAAVIAAFLLFFGAYFYLSDQLAGAIEAVVAYQGQGPGGSPRFFDRYGNLLFELHPAEKRRWLNYDEIPAVVMDAAVAVEDDTFWENPGFDPEAIAAALVSNYRTQPERPAGASTITQQLVRHIAFSYQERITPSYERKLKELFLAFILTRQRSKQDILTMYLNEIYYGNLAYGVEAAAQTYFGRGAAELSLPEAAFLAALPQAPAQLDPYANFDAVKARQELVLDLMLDEGMLEADAAEAAKAAPIQLAPLLPAASETADSLRAPHFVLYVQRQLEGRYGAEALIRGGWQITTTLDLRLQSFAETAARQWVGSLAANDVDNASAVVLKPASGEILAMLGSLDYFNAAIDGQVNVALMPRQPGSSIKPVTYAAAMERGWTTGDVLWDVPIELDLGGGQKMTPVNYDGRYHGPLLLRDALANSYNIPPIQLIRDVGIPAFIATGRKMGIESLTEPPGYYGLALTLGGGEVPLLEMTHAYATLANQGRRPRLTGVLEIRDSRGQLLFSQASERVPAANALDPRIAYILTDILDDDLARAPAFGRSSPLTLSFPAAAKTGTTTDFRDDWTLGYTPGVVVGVWVGNTDGHPMVGLSGVRGAAPLWRTLMEGIYADPEIQRSLLVDGVAPPAEFPPAAGIEERQVCLPRGAGGASCAASRPDWLLVGGPIHGIQRLGYVPDAQSQPGAWRLAVAPLSAEAAQSISLRPLENGLRPPRPSQCVLNTGRPPEGVAVRLFLPVPPFYPDEVRARIWAAQAGYAIAPPSVCPLPTARQALQASSGLSGAAAGAAGLDLGGGGAAAVPPPPAGLSYRIDAPAAGQTVSGVVPILGIANFNPAEYAYYKVEIGQGAAPGAWTTLGATHSQPVNGGQLETLHAAGLPPGDYALRLVVVGRDGNFAAPHVVPIRIAP